MIVNQATIDLVKRWEGLKLEAYLDPIGIWTIGYGHSERAGYGPVPEAGMKITQEEAEALLAEGLQRFAQGVAPLLKREPTENQFGAMVSLAYNIGVGAFSRSTCLKRFNAGDMEGAAEALTWFNKAGGKTLRGLVRRREEERDLFLSEQFSEKPTAKPDPEKQPIQSTTLWSALAGSGGLGVTAFQFWQQLETWEKGVVLLAALALAWIARERLARFARGDG
jgi:lysozyme